MQFDNLQDIIEFAIAKEEESVNLYMRLATRVESKAVADELLKMARMEQGHRDWLAKNGVALAANEANANVANLSIADYTEESVPDPGMSWQDVVNFAMHRETASVNLYKSLAQLVTDPTAKQVFENLAVEESRHKLYFETIWDEEVLSED